MLTVRSFTGHILTCKEDGEHFQSVPEIKWQGIVECDRMVQDKPLAAEEKQGFFDAGKTTTIADSIKTTCAPRAQNGSHSAPLTKINHDHEMFNCNSKRNAFLSAASFGACN